MRSLPKEAEDTVGKNSMSPLQRSLLQELYGQPRLQQAEAVPARPTQEEPDQRENGVFKNRQNLDLLLAYDDVSIGLF